ncbi:hypothetical protein CTM71_00405 [Fusobacterium pseudoperiodonticum]|uniref:Uncharacterized protein n=1 Tax=Fusobacterium pseudoperiodonticum TaxID=2663009 RepID=A0A2G9EDL9_9FUSO|nr:hypothetical protein CTM78_02075 [Fusobacterium pseudoperiodonticum]PIM79027.1 hypothetical protein CTM71_00405 [Fusobacterium pseudoperiodonticum]
MLLLEQALAIITKIVKIINLKLFFIIFINSFIYCENPFFSSLCLLYALVSNGFISTFSPFKLMPPLKN